jgi:hypothetical protein
MARGAGLEAGMSRRVPAHIRAAIARDGAEWQTPDGTPVAALFELPAPCGVCGRTQHGGACSWCSAASSGFAAGRRASSAVTVDPEWKARAEAWLERQPTGTRFTADHLVAAVGLPHGSPNQVGATIRAWAGHRIRAIGAELSTRRECHGRLVRVWQVRP